MGSSTDPCHYRRRHFVLLSCESPRYKNRERCCRGSSYCPTPAWWIQLRVDFRTRSLQQTTCTESDATPQLSEQSEKTCPECGFDCTLTDHSGFLPLSRSRTDGHISLPNIVISIATLVEHLGTHPGALIPQRMSVREVRGGATVHL